ncbi:MAG: hypothetical protein LUG12_12775 [Erysipelotrichaceae bacterium]|nr:hypothetical protein [Erysipelotrichaceae bacterium]
MTYLCVSDEELEKVTRILKENGFEVSVRKVDLFLFIRQRSIKYIVTAK